MEQASSSPLKPQPRRPLFGVAIAFAVGILLAYLLQPPFLLSTLLTYAFIAGALIFRERLPLTGYILTLAAIATVGSGYFSFRTNLQALSAEQIGRITPFPARVRGVVAELPEVTILQDVAGAGPDQFRIRFPLRVEAMCVDEAWTPFSGTMQITGTEQTGEAEAAAGERRLSDLRYGDRIELACEVSRLPRPGNPGEFDYGAYLALQGIGAVGRMPANAAAQMRQGRGGLAALRWIDDAKVAMRRFLDERLPAEQSALLKCLVLGDRRARTRQQEEPYVKTGTVHFLAVSGFNVVLLALPIWYLLALLKVGHRASSLVVLIVVALYAVIAGLNPPVVRAAVMVVIVCSGYLLKRQSNFLNSMSLAAIIVLLINPADLFSAGFQLSFVAVLGISFFMRRLRRVLFRRDDTLEQLKPDQAPMTWLHYPQRWAETGICTSLAAFLSTAGLVAYYYHMLAPISPILILIETPLVCLITCLGFPAALLGPLIGDIAAPLASAAGLCAQLFDSLTTIVSYLPGIRFFVGEWGLFSAVMFYAFLMVVALAPRLRLRTAHVCMIGLLLASGYAGIGLIPRAHRYEMAMLDVGGGCATLIQLPDGTNILNDCGSGGDPTVGTRVVAPFLWRKGVKRIDIVLISHADSDHWNGLQAVAERFSIGRVLVPAPALATRPEGARLSEMLSRRGLNVQTVSAGDRIQIGDAAEIEILGPVPAAASLAKMSPNNLSCVARLIRPEATVLLTGDVQEAGIAILMSRVSDLHTDVMMASHHGHAIANLPLFLSAVQPRMILVSGWQIAAAYQRGLWRLLDTGSHGAIQIEFAADERGQTRVAVRTGAQERLSLTQAWPGGRSQNASSALQGL